VPWRLAFASRAACLNLVVLKELSFATTPPEGFHEAPQMPQPRCTVGTAEEWAFGANVGSLNALDAEPLPSIYLCDFLRHWLRGRPALVAPLGCLCCAVDALLAAASARSRGLKLAAMLLLVPTSLLEGYHVSSIARSAFKWSKHRAGVLGTFCGLVSFLAVIIMVTSAFWISAQWKLWQDGGPEYVSELGGVSEERTWSLYLRDGFVDKSRERSSHLMCHNVHHVPSTWPCSFLFASPIYRDSDAVEAPTQHDPVAWAVGVGKHPRNVLCAERGGICGFAAARMLTRPELDRFLGMVGGSADPPMIVVGDPEDYLHEQRVTFLVAFACLVLASPAGLAALRCLLDRRTSAGEAAVRDIEREDPHLNADGEGLLELLRTTRAAENATESGPDGPEESNEEDMR